MEFEDDDHYTGPPVDDDAIRRAEQELGVVLPVRYVEILRDRNGGIPTARRWMTGFPTSWADDHFEIRALLGVGGETGIDSPEQGSRMMIAEWGYPDIGVVICDMPSGGHDAVLLDYRESDTDPAVAYVDEDRVPRVIASDFAAFEAGLVE